MTAIRGMKVHQGDRENRSMAFETLFNRTLTAIKPILHQNQVRLAPGGRSSNCRQRGRRAGSGGLGVVVLERRLYPRFDVKVPLTMRVLNKQPEQDRRIEGGLRDLSCMGALVETSAPLGHRDVMELTFTLPEQGAEVRAFADVMWLKPDQDSATVQAGLRFLYLREQDRMLIARENVKELLAGIPEAKADPARN